MEGSCGQYSASIWEVMPILLFKFLQKSRPVISCVGLNAMTMRMGCLKFLRKNLGLVLAAFFGVRVYALISQKKSDLDPA